MPASAAECVSEELLAAFAAGSLSADEVSSVEQHLARCEDCRRVVAATGVSGTLGTAGALGTLAPTTTTLDASDDGVEQHLTAGTRVGRYVVQSLIGSGSMGDVYAAHDPELDRRVAIKLLRARGSHHAAESVATRMRREAQAMARLSHPNVVTVYDVGTFEGRVFVAMEHVEGGTLRSWLQRARPWRDVLDRFEHAGRGLAAAHAAGLVHRDFKPDNVLVGSDGRVRVTDFGLARGVPGVAGDVMAAADDAPGVPLHETITRTGTLVGTPAYMAPEQLAGIPADARADMFGFCVALYEGLYGERPFTGKTLAELRASTTSGVLRQPPRGSRVPPAVRRALAVGLRRRPEERYPSMDALLAALRTRPRARWPLVLALGAGAATLVAIPATRAAFQRVAPAGQSGRDEPAAAAVVSSAPVGAPEPAPVATASAPVATASSPVGEPTPAAPPRAARPATKPRPTEAAASVAPVTAPSSAPPASTPDVKLGRNGAPILR